MKTLEQLGGALVLVMALADVFLTILYARMDSGLLAMRYVHGIERLWVWISRGFGRSLCPRRGRARDGSADGRSDRGQSHAHVTNGLRAKAASRAKMRSSTQPARCA